LDLFRHLGEEDRVSWAGLALFGFDLLRPQGLFGLAAAGAVLFLGALALRSRKRAVHQLVSLRQSARFLPQFSSRRARWRLVLATLGLALLSLAAAGPVRGYTVREKQRKGLDLVVCVDTSRSMLVRDLRPDRLTRARREVRGLLDHLGGDRVALIAFSGDAREVAPLTHDHRTLSALIDDLAPDENLKGGTDLGAALDRALAMFDGRTGAHEAIILITDGEDLEGRGLEAAKAAAEKHIRVYVVGMGTEQGGKIPTLGPNGQETFVKDKLGQEVVSAMGGKGLAEIASTTGGAYIAAGESASPLEELYQKRISQLEGLAREAGEEWVPHDRFQWFLVLAFACVLAETALREKRPRVRAGRILSMRRAQAMGVAPFALALLQAATPPAVQQAPGTDVNPPAPEPKAAPPYPGSPRTGLIELQARARDHKSAEAVELGQALLAVPTLSDRDRAEVSYDLGVARLAQREPDGELAGELGGDLGGALADFHRSRALAGPGSLRMDAMYNVGAVELERAEALRQELPEIRQKLGLPPQPKLPQAAGGGAPDEDLRQAEAQYLTAKVALAERLRAGLAAKQRDADTCANLELIQRRLRELADLREKRQQEQKDQDSKDPKEDQQNPKQDSKSSQGKEPPKDPNGDTKGDPKESQQPNPQEQPKDDSKPQDKEQPKPSETKAPKPGDERVLTKEEVQRLLDQLGKIEQEAEQVRAHLRVLRRPPVERDW
jgi:Ca-activated chloride channel homolog